MGTIHLRYSVRGDANFKAGNKDRWKDETYPGMSVLEAVRECQDTITNKDEHGNVISYVYIGDCDDVHSCTGICNDDTHNRVDTIITLSGWDDSDLKHIHYLVEQNNEQVE